MWFELRLEWIAAQIVQGVAQDGAEVGVFAQELASAPLEVVGGDERKTHASSASSARIRASAFS